MLFALSLCWVLLIQEPDCLNCAGQLDGVDGEVSIPAAGEQTVFSVSHHFVSVLESVDTNLPFLGR